MNRTMTDMAADAGAVGATPPPVAVAAAVGACAAVALVLGRRWWRGEPLLPSRARRPVPWRGADVAFVFCVSLGLTVAAGGVVPASQPLVQRLAASTVALVAGLACGVIHLRARGATWGDLGCDLRHGAADLRTGVAGVALVLAPLLALAALLDRLVPYAHPIIDLLRAHRDPTAVALVVVSAVIVAPLAEEFFFRRVLQGWLEAGPAAGDATAAVVASAAAFAVAHWGQGLAVVPLFLLGLVLGAIAHRTGSIVPCVVLHALFNAASVALLLGGLSADPGNAP